MTPEDEALKADAVRWRGLRDCVIEHGAFSITRINEDLGSKDEYSAECVWAHFGDSPDSAMDRYLSEHPGT